MSEEENNVDDLTPLDNDDLSADWEAALSEQLPGGAAADEGGGSQGGGGGGEGGGGSGLSVSDASGDEVNLNVILDIPVTISMEVGRTKISIRNLLQLNQGSVVELDRLAGEPMDVLVNGTLIAHGEVVVVNEKFGIRLTDVISPQERVRKLK